MGAHQKGRVVDVNQGLDGDGPFSPERSGTLPVGDLVRLCFSGNYSEKEILKMITGKGGLVAYLETNSASEVERRAAEGDAYAKLIYDAMAYQLAKNIGSYAAVLEGKVDGIIMTGGVSNDKVFVEKVSKMVSFIARIEVYGGDFEMEALASGASRALNNDEELKEYTGVPVWKGFNLD